MRLAEKRPFLVINSTKVYLDVTKKGKILDQ